MTEFFTTLYAKKNETLSLTFLLVLLFSVTMVSCSGSKKFYKKGVKLQESGMHTEAADAFYASLLRNRDNTDAKIGMKKSGQQVLSRKLEKFSKFKTLEEKKKAVYSYIAALQYKEKIQKVGVTLEIPPFYTSDYESVTQSYLADLYEAGIGLLEDGKFEEAEVNFKEIGNFDSNYKDANNLEDIAYLEPLYTSGIEHYNALRFRSAYNDFSAAANRDSEFKDCVELKNQCLEDGLFTMALLPFENSTNQNGLDQKISAYALDALTNINDPFLKVVDRENMQLIINEQQLGLSGVIDEETAVNVGNLTGAQALITGTVLGLDVQKGRLTKISRTGFESYRVKKTNPETKKTYYETRYRSTYYHEYTQKNTATVTFQYKVISLETGEVIDSRIVDQTIDDRINYAEFKGDGSNLWPERNGQAYTNRNAKRQLDNLLSADRAIKSTSELSNDLLREVSYEISASVSKLMLELVK